MKILLCFFKPHPHIIIATLIWRKKKKTFSLTFFSKFHQICTRNTIEEEARIVWWTLYPGNVQKPGAYNTIMLQHSLSLAKGLKFRATVNPSRSLTWLTLRQGSKNLIKDTNSDEFISYFYLFRKNSRSNTRRKNAFQYCMYYSHSEVDIFVYNPITIGKE